jgi:hypothetical protein
MTSLAEMEISPNHEDKAKVLDLDALDIAMKGVGWMDFKDCGVELNRRRIKYSTGTDHLLHESLYKCIFTVCVAEYQLISRSMPFFSIEEIPLPLNPVDVM